MCVLESSHWIMSADNFCIFLLFFRINFMGFCTFSKERKKKRLRWNFIGNTYLLTFLTTSGCYCTMRSASRGEYVWKRRKESTAFQWNFLMWFLFLFGVKCNSMISSSVVYQSNTSIPRNFLLLHLFNFESVNIINKTHRINTNIDSIVVFKSIHACINAKFTLAFIRNNRDRECNLNVKSSKMCHLSTDFQNEKTMHSHRPVSNTICSMELFCIRN